MQEHLSLAKTQNLTKVRGKWARKREGNPGKGAIFSVPSEVVERLWRSPFAAVFPPLGSRILRTGLWQWFPSHFLKSQSG